MINENSLLLLTSSLFLSFFSLNLSHFFSLNSRRSHSYPHFLNQLNINVKRVAWNLIKPCYYIHFLSNQRKSHEISNISFLFSQLYRVVQHKGFLLKPNTKLRVERRTCERTALYTWKIGTCIWNYECIAIIGTKNNILKILGTVPRYKTISLLSPVIQRAATKIQTWKKLRQI